MQVQLFLTAMSLPILLSWGLPISILAPLGNLLFFPALVGFLTLSSCIFFLELFQLPNSWPIFALEHGTTWWLKVLSLGNSTRWLVGFAKPSIIFLITVPLCALLIIANKKIGTVKRSIVALSLLLALSFTYLKLSSAWQDIFINFECNGGHVTLVRTNGTTALIDPGVIGRRISATSWAEYTLAPQIIQTTGANSIDHLIVLQPGILTFEALEKLCTTTQIKTIYLTTLEGTLTKNGWRSFFSMKRAAQEQGVTLVRIGTRKQQINLSRTTHLTLTPLDKRIPYQEATYPALCLTGQIDNKPFTLYSAKYKGNKIEAEHYVVERNHNGK